MGKGQSVVRFLIAALLTAQPATAEDVFKKMFKRLDQAGRKLEEKLTGKEKTDRTVIARSAMGTCQVFSPAGIQMDNDPCKNEEVCHADQTCFQRYIWPSGSVTTVEKRGGSWALNGELASIVTFRGETCLQVSITGNYFCFWDQNQTVPDLSVRDPVAAETATAPTLSNETAGSPSVADGHTQEAGGLVDEKRREEESVARQREALAKELAEVERQRAEEIAREQAEIAKRQEDKRRAAEEAAVKRAKADAEQKAKIDMIAGMTGPADIDRFFKGATADRLAPVDASGKCVEHFLIRATAIANPVPIDAAAALQARCVSAAEKYGQHILASVANEMAVKTKTLPATLEGLRANDWFRPDATVFASFTEPQVEALRARYDQEIAPHKNAAISSALKEIAAAFQAADPLAQSGDAALALCALEGLAPDELIDACASQRNGYMRRTEVARCEHAISESGASAYMLDLPVEAFGSDRERWALRKLICVGANRHPEFLFSVGNGRIPVLTTRSLSIRDRDDEDILDVEFRVASSRDGRSFMKLLLDILTGENEKPVREELVVERIRYAAPRLNNFPRSTVVGCVLDIFACR